MKTEAMGFLRSDLDLEGFLQLFDDRLSVLQLVSQTLGVGHLGSDRSGADLHRRMLHRPHSASDRAAASWD